MAESYIEFREIAVTTKTKQWDVFSTSDTHLGLIKFYPQWRCFVFVPTFDTLFNVGCMTDIATFCDEQTKSWRKSKIPSE